VDGQYPRTRLEIWDLGVPTLYMNSLRMFARSSYVSQELGPIESSFGKNYMAIDCTIEQFTRGIIGHFQSS
jgi:hypothetical protein